ncbi:caspase family protein [Rhizobium sp. L1K21]|uniref:caspase family protein n=1 Tax=Rhizobium sp. L1K21 TaxID=2954933 RepID=UPI002092BEF1|nr:caspase family protein [Rhizobium sp. L1K21]
MDAFAERRVALVVGNDSYSSVPALKRAVNDSTSVAEALQEIGFDKVISMQNLTRSAFNRAVRDFSNELQEGDTAFFYFSGHGVAVGGNNYLLPVDFPEIKDGDDDRLVADESRSVASILEDVQARGAGRVFMILDACRNNPFPKVAGRSIGRSGGGLVSEKAVAGVFMLYSAGFGQQALDRLYEEDGKDADPNSVFTRNLLPLIKKPGLSQLDIAKQLQTSVRTLAATVQHNQNPAYYDQIEGYYVLNPKPVSQPEPAPPAKVAEDVSGQSGTPKSAPSPAAGASSASSDWQLIKELKQPEVFEAFKKKYAGDPIYETLADQQIALLKLSNPVVPPVRSVAPETECDRLAAHPFDLKKVAGVKGVDFSKIRPEAVEACESAVAQYPGEIRFEAQLGRALSKVGRDDEALVHYRKAADQGYAVAQSDIGFYYENGLAVPKDYDESYRWYRMAADQGYATAQYNVGVCYGEGRGVQKDDKEALRWWREAAGQGMALAMNSIGIAYQNGEGVKKDNVEAMWWFRKAVDGGHIGALYSVARLYEMGDGLPADREEAADFMLKALLSGDDFAKKQMDTDAQSWSLEFRRALQVRLRERGYYQGAIDGSFGSGTLAAINAVYGAGDD